MNPILPIIMQVGLFAAATLAVCGCSDDTTAVLSDSSIAASSTAGGDKGENAQGPTTTTPGGVGHIEVEAFFIGAVFFAKGAILRARSHPECVVQLNPSEGRFSPAGTLTVSSDLVGTPGGPPAPFVINPDPSMEYFEFPDPPLFNFSEGSSVQLALTGTSVLPPIPVTTFAQPLSEPSTSPRRRFPTHRCCRYRAPHR